jgi:carbamoyl-phosphate synthase small subunit
VALDPAILLLEDGTRYSGHAYGAHGRTFGEAVFATGMTGYQETLTDPSYAGQIVVMTAPHIGNTGVNDEDPESSRIWVSGYVVRDPSRIVSNYRAKGSLGDQLVANGIVGISGLDTRAITRRLRDAGVMRAGIFSGADAALPHSEQLELVRGSAEMSGRNLSAEVSTEHGYELPAEGDRRRCRARSRGQGRDPPISRCSRIRCAGGSADDRPRRSALQQTGCRVLFERTG